MLCYETLDQDDMMYHERCHARSCIAAIDPIIPYTLDEMYELAEKVVGESISVTGVQPKISLNTYKEAGEKHGKLTIINYPGRFILKPPSPRYEQLPENEDLTMKLAELSGISTVPHCMVRLKSGEPAYISKRIDRINGEKIHMEDMCQISGRLTEDKYRGSIEGVAKIIRLNSENMMFDVISFFELVLFSFITGNSDMHLKNFSLIYSKDGPHLAPAYDLLNTRVVIPDDKEESALTINEKKNRISLKDFVLMAEKSSIPEKSARNTFQRFSGLKSEYCTLIEKSFLSDLQKEAYRDCIVTQFNKLDL
jgi:serine/threonine-protein kinase HipA